MAKLNNQQKVFLVQCLAEWHTLSEAADAFNEKYGIELIPQQIERYDPTKAAGQTLAKDLKALFVRHREAYLKDTKAHVPIANKTVRLQMLSAMTRKAMQAGNHVQAAKYLEQAAKEMGGSYTNLKQYSGKDGKPIQFEDVTKMPTEQLEAELRALGIDPDEVRPVTASIN